MRKLFHLEGVWCSLLCEATPYCWLITYPQNFSFVFMINACVYKNPYPVPHITFSKSVLEKKEETAESQSCVLPRMCSKTRWGCAQYIVLSNMCHESLGSIKNLKNSSLYPYNSSIYQLKSVSFSGSAWPSG